ncbi:hypothetical protein E1301_Tti007814 [Triplophysa tibetana]|uniref:C2H2-type domain-containing protein n=1 Tax=Triplophysa tibetana TaxID=1572043 RepID=A0A5A9MYG1_9TELE|nr:hypothetical protein E1301_Tti007814 [Triplophysa tibetana]
MSLLECEVVAILETLVKTAVHEMTKVFSRGTSAPTDTAVNEPANVEFTTQLNCVLEEQAREAGVKLCQLFSAILQLELNPGEVPQDSLTSRLKQSEKQQKSTQEDTESQQRNWSADQLMFGEAYYCSFIDAHNCFSVNSFKMCGHAITATEDKYAVVVNWGQEKIIVNDEVEMQTAVPSKKNEQDIDSSAMQEDAEKSNNAKVSKNTKVRVSVRRKGQQFNCKHCKRKFDSYVRLRAHWVVHAATAEKPFCCTQCDKHFPDKRSLDVHRMLHKGPYICDQCDTTFTKFKEFQTHQKIHKADKSFTCKDCGKSFQQAYGLRKHLVVHSAEKQVCGKTLNSISALKSHQHADAVISKYSCNVCGKSFKSAGYLKVHTRIHTGEKPFSCSVCGKAFHQQASLKAHQILHTGERPFGCDVCEKGFCTLGNLRRHQRIHTGEKPFTCEVCGRGFNQSNSLKAHMHIHTGQKPYMCDKCGKSFAYLRNMKSHKCL